MSIRNARVSLDNFLLHPQPTKSVIADEWDAPSLIDDEENALAPVVVQRKRDIVSVVLDMEDRQGADHRATFKALGWRKHFSGHPKKDHLQ